ncbi:MAG: hypothetical protein AAGF11_03085 [Myxococcota bacterium]
MSQEDYLRSFFQALEDRPLEPEDRRYVRLYEGTATSEDPIAQLESGIEWTAQGSVQLLSGFRGTGKSTELRRLRSQLRAKGSYRVALCDMRGYLNLSEPVDVSDFLIAATGALSEELRDEELLGRDQTRETYWERFSNFATRTKVDLGGPELGVPGAKLKTNLKNDPSFRRRIQRALEGSLGSLVEDVREFVTGCINELRRMHGEDTQLVVIFDSVEQFQGTYTNAAEVQASLETLFVGHADKLSIPGVHLIYTVPPWLKIRFPGVSQVYTGAYLMPCIKVRDRQGQPWAAGIDALERIVAERGDWTRLLENRQALEHLIEQSGGYLRDLFRLLQAGLRRGRGRALPLTQEDIDFIVVRARDAYLPIAIEDARWLARVAKTHEAELPEAGNLPHLSRYLDTHLLLCYRNGDEWYDIHPLIAEKVHQLASRPMIEPYGSP